MKKNLLLVLAISAMIITTVSISFSDSTGKTLHTYAPNENSCSESGCHGSGQGGLADNAGPGSISISCPSMPGWVYTPGQVYNFSITVTQASCNLFGFSCLAINSGNGNAGAMSVTDNVHTKSVLHSATGKSFITHTGLLSPLPGTATTTNPAVFNFAWTAPATNVGPIRIYFDGVAANNDLLEDAGDNVYSSSQLINPAAPVSSPLIMSTLNPSASYPIYLRTTTGVPSVTQNFDVAGLALTGNLTISVPSPFQISTSSSSGFSTSPINLTPSSGTVNATKIYIRYNPTLAGSTAAVITVSSSSATSATGNVTGTIATPVISTPSSTALATFTTIVGTPSTIDSFTVSSSGLVDNFIVTAPPQFEISHHRYTAYLNSSSAPIFIPTWGYSSMKLYVRYNPSVAGTHTGNIVLSSTGAVSKTVAVVGNSSALAVPEELAENNINIYPNPASNSAQLSFNLSSNQNLVITMRNVEGKEVKTITSKTFDKGKNEVAIDCSNLSKGLYFIGIQSKGKNIYKKFVVQ